MCGITGFIGYGVNKFDSNIVINNMVATLKHRGPDDYGNTVLESNQSIVALAQSRLSIIDLSAGGHQPMQYKQYSIVFNGEIYNYKELKKELVELGHHFKSDSDTEVILHAHEEWGNEAIKRFIGMFAYGIFDSLQNRLVFVRDRAGVKPFYYYHDSAVFLFASELKAFHEHPQFKKEIEKEHLKYYFQNVHQCYIPAPHTIFKNTFKLLPGHFIDYDVASNTINIQQYWNVLDYYQQPKLNVTYQEAKEEVHTLIKSACAYRMVADVPVGVFLSGGYDSTLVTAILQANRSEKLKTFTIGFEEGNNEAPYAKETAKYFGTSHNEHICTTREAQEIIPTLPYFYDEPFADSSAIPTMLVSQLARKTVTVALSADAGDEVFAGYTSYALLAKKLQHLNKIPDSLKPFASSLGKGISSMMPVSMTEIKHQLQGAAAALQANQFKQAGSLFRFMNKIPNYYTDNLFAEPDVIRSDAFLFSIDGFQEPLEIAMANDYLFYLPNDILTKVDRATMSVSLEGREPLLDHRLVEYAARLPLEYKWDGKTGKKILKDIVHDYLPKSMMDRPKTGFSLPIYDWLRGDLDYLIDNYLSPEALGESGLFNVAWISEQVRLFKNRQLHYQPLIWKLLMFQMWYKRWM